MKIKDSKPVIEKTKKVEEVKESPEKLSFLAEDEQDENALKNFSMSDFAAFKKLSSYAGPHKWGLIIGFILLLGSSLCALISARSLGALVEEGLLVKDSEASFRFAYIVIGLELGSLLFMWIGRRLISLLSSKTILSIREALFNHLQLLPISFYDRQPQGRVVTRVTHDVEGIEDFFTSSMGRLLNASFMAILAGTAMIITDWRLGLILMASVVPACLFIFATRQKVRTANRGLSKARSVLNAKLSEFLSGMDVIRTYALESWSKDQYDEQVSIYRESHLRANSLYAWTRPFVSFLCAMPLVLLVWFGGRDVMSGAMSVGLFVTFIRYCERFSNPIMVLAREVHVIQQAFTSAERVASFLNHSEEGEFLGADGDLTPKNMEGSISFEKVWMSYNPEEWILKGLDFNIRKGEKIGLVGSTGCGKTTTVSLLSRLYEYQRGDIKIDGHSIRSYQRDFLRSQLGFVSQDAVIFRGSFRQNLSTDQSVSDDKILKSCEVTGLSRVMNMGGWTLESEIFEGGENLSVGERQLVSLTRVLIDNPTILILDEATANIDPWFEKIIHQAVDRVMEGRTCLMIAHRLETLDHCDRILVFDKGEMVESGSKEELLAHGDGYFHKLHSAQFKDEKTAPPLQ